MFLPIRPYSVVQFHHYNDQYKGNLIPLDFTGGMSPDLKVAQTVFFMGSSTHEIRPHKYKSAAAGMVYNDMPPGTDSLAFGGWKT